MDARVKNLVSGILAFSIGAAGGALVAGARVEARERPAPAASPKAQDTYACPMHPEVRSHRHDDRCPKCGMFLEKVKK